MTNESTPHTSLYFRRGTPTVNGGTVDSEEPMHKAQREEASLTTNSPPCIPQTPKIMLGSDKTATAIFSDPSLTPCDKKLIAISKTSFLISPGTRLLDQL